MCSFCLSPLPLLPLLFFSSISFFLPLLPSFPPSLPLPFLPLSPLLPPSLPPSLPPRYPHLACELLTSEVFTIVEQLSTSESLLNMLWDFLDSSTPLNPLLASFVSKVLSMLLTKEPNVVSWVCVCVSNITCRPVRSMFFSSLLCYAPILFKSPYFAFRFPYYASWLYLLCSNFERKIHFLNDEIHCYMTDGRLTRHFIEHSLLKSLCWDFVKFSLRVSNC